METQKSSISTPPVLFALIGDTSVEANPPGKIILRYLVNRSFEGIIVGLYRGDKSVHGCGPIVLK